MNLDLEAQHQKENKYEGILLVQFMCYHKEHDVVSV